MHSGILTRVVAILLLFVAGATVYACDYSDSCVTPATQSDSGCDDPGGDACFCCCHHILPVLAFTLEATDAVYEAPPPEPVGHLVSRALPIDHPPQL